MDNVKTITVIRQLFSLLPVDVQERFLLDRYSKKLTIVKAMMIFLSAQWNHWSSYSEMETHIRAHSELKDILSLESISAAQLSRKLDVIPTELLEWLFLQLAARAEQRLSEHSQAVKRMEKLCIIDSTNIPLPLQLGNWAQVTSARGGVKMHLRLVVGSPDQVFPDAMVPSSMRVNDRVGALEMVKPADAIYVMDRGYDDYKKMDQWVSDNIRFVIRMRDRALTTIIEECDIPQGSKIVRDAKVHVGGSFRSMKHPVRLIEFFDEQGRLYRIFTSVWDKDAEEIAHIYKCRWLIELYFKWIKQHLRLKKVMSYKPQALWNQLFLVLLAAMLVEELKQSTVTTKNTWQFLRMLRAYMYHTWSAFEVDLQRAPSRKSRGKPPGSRPKEKSLRTGIGILRVSKPMN